MNRFTKLSKHALVTLNSIVFLFVVVGIVVSELDAEGPTIDVWYGTNQSFGQIGNPQAWVNILGNVSDPDGVASLSYSLNGGPQMPLSIGPNGNRLENDGDFNIEIAYADLNDGPNQVEITAADNNANQSVETVTVKYAGGNVWPLGYETNWEAASSIAEQAQVVDGLWSLEGGDIRSIAPGYDRLVAIGDISWQNYEVTVPITLLSTSSGSNGAGIVVRWQGHFQQGNEQPRVGWQQLGAYGYYKYQDGVDRHLALRLDGSGPMIDYGVLLDLGIRYIFKLRVETPVPGGGGFYSLKVWEDGEPEPSTWNMTDQDGPLDMSNGSLLLVAHKVDATFGNVSVVPLSNDTVTLTTGVVGHGSVSREPDQPEYTLGQVVALTANPDPDWEFAGWSGDLTGTDNPTSLTMIGNRVVTATFTTDITYTMVVNTVGGGSVELIPDRPYYDSGEVVTLTATDAPGWEFSGWSGDVTGDTNPAMLTMDSSKEVTATFSPVSTYTLSVVSTGNGTVTADPDQPHYNEGAVVTLTATAESGWSFSGWTGDLSGSDNPATLTMDRDRAVTAVFAPMLDCRQFLATVRK